MPEEDNPEEEISDILIKAQKIAKDIDKSDPVRMIASTELSVDPVGNEI